MEGASITARIIQTTTCSPPYSLASHQIQTLKHHHQSSNQNPNLPITSRRNALLLVSLVSAAVADPPNSAAISFGISGPKEWLRDQKKKAAKFVLAPIESSRQSLQTAYLLLTSPESKDDNAEEIRSFLNSATRDCVPQSRSLIVAFQANTGVEVCTFKLIVKNASSLLDKSNPVKMDAESRLGDLIRDITRQDCSMCRLSHDLDLLQRGETVGDNSLNVHCNHHPVPNIGFVLH